MIDLAYTKAELAEEKKEMAAGPSGEADPYPWGMCIRMESETLAKLGLDDPLPHVGGEVHMLVIAKVTSVNMSARATQKDETCVGFQITMAQVLKVEGPEEEAKEVETPKAEARETPVNGGMLGAY
jgi:hypothetical protein